MKRDAKAIQKSERELRKALKTLTANVAEVLDALDREMGQPGGVDRGRRIAVICNGLQFANDSARHFALGEPLSSLSRKPRSGKAA